MGMALISMVRMSLPSVMLVMLVHHRMIVEFQTMESMKVYFGPFAEVMNECESHLDAGTNHILCKSGRC